LLVCCVSWSISLLTWIIALHWVTILRAALICATHPLFMICWLRCIGTPILSIEWIGVVVAFSGIVVSSGQKLFDASNNDPDSILALVGDALCLLSASMWCTSLIAAKKVTAHLPLFMYTFITTTFVVFASSIASIIFEDSTFSMSITGLGGWLLPAWIHIMLIFAIVVGLFTMTAYNYAVQYIDSLVFSTVQLLDPAVAGAIAWILGYDGDPDLWTWIGLFVVSGGVGLTVYGEHVRTKKSNATAHSIEMARSDDSISSDKLGSLAPRVTNLDTGIDTASDTSSLASPSGARTPPSLLSPSNARSPSSVISPHSHFQTSSLLPSTPEDDMSSVQRLSY